MRHSYSPNLLEHDMLVWILDKIKFASKNQINMDQIVTYASYLRMHHYLEHACHISDLQSSCCNLHYVCPGCLYSCYKVTKILNWWSVLIVVRWNNDLGFIKCLPTYRVIELMCNLWICGRNRKWFIKSENSDII